MANTVRVRRKQARGEAGGGSGPAAEGTGPGHTADPAKCPPDAEERVRDVLHMSAVLADVYPDARWELDFDSPLQLLVATILSAQATDERINQVTPALFARYPTAADYARADKDELEGLIRSTGFFRNKANQLMGMAAALQKLHGGRVPQDLAALVALPGVGRKTANVILGNAFGIPRVVVDTHVGRVARRRGWTCETSPVKIEHALEGLILQPDWTNVSNRMVIHGRRVCHARNPACGVCPVSAGCPSFGAGPTDPVTAARLVRGPKASRALSSGASPSPDGHGAGGPEPPGDPISTAHRLRTGR